MYDISYLPKCLENPFISYVGKIINKENFEYLIRRILEIKAKYVNKAIFISYPCPEFALTLKAPRVPASKEMYEAVGMRKVANAIANWIENVINSLKPKKVVIVGIKYSPTCGVTGTYKLKDKRKLNEFLKYFMENRLDKGDYIKENMEKIEGESGILMEILKERFPNVVFLDFVLKTKKDIDESLLKLEKILP